MKAALKILHRYVSLLFAAVWMIQALTGLVMVFHWEWDDARVPGEHRTLAPLAVAAAAQRLQAERPDATVRAFYATAGAPDRFDIHIEDRLGRTDVVRVDGDGRTLVARPLDYDYPQAGFIQTAIVLHQTLFLGDRGKFFLGCSGIVLLTNIIGGLMLAWPRRGDWRRALLPALPRVRITKIFAWHRACGLWLALPACCLIAAGVLLAFEDPVEAFLGTDAPLAELTGVTSATVVSLKSAIVAPGVALQTAIAQFPSATLASLRMPSQGAPWYRVRLRQSGEAARVYGSTAVFVSAVDGHVLAIDDALKGGVNRRFVDALYPTHTGEVAGVVGRLLALTVGLWLLTMLVLGVTLWLGRRRSRLASSPVN